MKKLFFLFFALCITELTVKAQLVDVIVEEQFDFLDYVPENFSVYRVYARLQDASDYLEGVYANNGEDGSPVHSIGIGTWPNAGCQNVIYNSPFVGAYGSNINMSLCGVFMAACLDSWITIGAGELYSPDEAILSSVEPLGALGQALNPNGQYGNGSIIENGGWYSMPGSTSGVPNGPDNRVLLMQVICPTGELMYALNLKVLDNGIATNPLYYCHTLEDAPGMQNGVIEQNYTAMGLIYPSVLTCPSCNDPNACNYAENATNTLNCFYSGDCSTEAGCIDTTACNFNPSAIFEIVNSCIYPGCTNPLACNYDPNVCEGGYCVMLACQGCTDPTACNYLPTYEIDNGTCYYGTCGNPGCMDPLACNYDANADYEYTGVCNYNFCVGCTDPNACNYFSGATIDDGSCYYYIQGTVFQDLNGNGYIENNQFFQDVPMFNVEVVLEPIGISVFTDQDGFYSFPDVPAGTYNLSVVSQDISWLYSTSFNAFTTPTCMEKNIGITSSEFSYSWNSFGFQNDFMICIGYNYVSVYVHNHGSLPFEVDLIASFDPILEAEFWPQNYFSDPTVVGDGVMGWEDLELQPYSMEILHFAIISPGTDFIGEIFDFNFEIDITDLDGNSIYTENWTESPVVSCSYDPNDKYTAEPGYTEENHFVLAEDEMEYRVRFQNTGNFPAETVVISDTLDIEHLDFDSFYPVFASHDFMTTAEPNGALTFTFNDIMLPDSTSDQAGSQGYVVYRVRPKADVEHLDVIENTAYIFFDGNEPVVTNTTWHTIMDCNSLSGIVSEDNFCVGDVAYFNAEQSFIDEYTWTFNDTAAGSDPILAQELNDVGTFNIGVAISNPLCALTDEVEIIVNALPETDITQSGAIFTAPDGTSWQWYQDGELIEGATAQTFEAIESGYYEVFVTNETGCSVFSEEVMFVDINTIDEQTFELFPNPANGDAQLIFSQVESVQSISLYESTGRLIKVWNGVMTNPMRIDRGSLVSGTYILKVVLKNNQQKNIHVVFK